MKINKIYIIHYTKLTDRKENILSLLKNINIPYEFITVYDKEDLTTDVLEKYYNPNKELFDKKTNSLWGKEYKFRILNDAEISCTIKHLVAIEKIGEECEECGLILEDDAISDTEDFIGKIEECISSIENWDLIFFGEGCGVSFINQKAKNKITDSFYNVEHPASNCAEAYIVKSNVAKKIYNNATPFQLVSDWELAHSFYDLNLNIFWYIPSLFYQGSKSGKYKSELR